MRRRPPTRWRIGWPRAEGKSPTASSTSARTAARSCSARSACGRGDDIAICMENHPHFFEICWAAQRSGPLLHADQLAPHAARGRVHRARLRREGAGRLARRRATSPSALAGALPRVSSAASWWTARAAGFELVGRGVRALARHAHRRRERGRADLLYSSGTTGRPKGVKLPAARQADRHAPRARGAAQGALRRRRSTPSISRPRRSTTPRRCASACPAQRLGATRDRDGALRRRRGARADRAPPRHALASGCRRCSCAC